ncbi:hypothetical protein AVV36_gp022 [Pectobacterium bacteriophage PM2]|uniref:Uncharacterized protein n=1 Tax=Pectobacterium bacteriophage PM2 TaxID=1429794 RepID=A0A0A0PZD9_9CAUD|nr:hypothetical protein AVV36_gp022 [Pectobacterium bacteriophage PM2]AHY24984.1 hypothetical protein PM2_022 [Pectobacterium bacteriophage PM2]
MKSTKWRAPISLTGGINDLIINEYIKSCPDYGAFIKNNVIVHAYREVEEYLEASLEIRHSYWDMFKCKQVFSHVTFTTFRC